ncbi:MAG: AEC family transporter [Bacillota bacterium]|nr:AEC family transporter [Bacillota bacterium]
MENLIFSLNATIPVFLIMVIGYLLRNRNIIDEPFVKTLNSFNFKVTLPVLLFRDITESDFLAVWDTKYVLFCFLSTLLCIAVIWIITAKVSNKKDLVGEFVQSSYRSSAAILGIAFIQNIYGNAGMAPLMIIGTVPLYNVAAVIILSFTGPESQGLNSSTLKKSLKGIITNPIILGILAGIIFSLLPIKLPLILSKTINNISSLATPLALIGLGAGFEGKKALAKIKPTLICSFIKLILQPAVFLPIAVCMGFRTDKLVALLIMLGAPTTVSCYIMAKNMHHEGVLTSSVVVTTTFLSSITITAWLYLLKSLQLI